MKKYLPWTLLTLGLSFCHPVHATDIVYNPDVSTFSKWKSIDGQNLECKQGKTVNAVGLIHVNKLAEASAFYMEDYPNDFWQNPAQTIHRGAGDCEDFALLKFALLRSMGHFDNEVVVVRRRVDNQIHAVLRVFLENGSAIMDDEVISEKTFDNAYQSLYAIGACGWRNLQ